MITAEIEKKKPLTKSKAYKLGRVLDKTALHEYIDYYSFEHYWKWISRTKTFLTLTKPRKKPLRKQQTKAQDGQRVTGVATLKSTTGRAVGSARTVKSTAETVATMSGEVERAGLQLEVAYKTRTGRNVAKKVRWEPGDA